MKIEIYREHIEHTIINSFVFQYFAKNSQKLEQFEGTNWNFSLVENKFQNFKQITVHSHLNKITSNWLHKFSFDQDFICLQSTRLIARFLSINVKTENCKWNPAHQRKSSCQISTAKIFLFYNDWLMIASSLPHSIGKLKQKRFPNAN